jgi:hypothetical protein
MDPAAEPPPTSLAEASGFASPPRDGFALVGLERLIDGLRRHPIGHMPIEQPSRGKSSLRTGHRPVLAHSGLRDLAALKRQRNGVRARGRAEFGHRVAHVGAHGLGREEQLLRRLLARQALRQEPEDLALAR